MSNRCNEKRITRASRSIKFLREQAGMSLKVAAKASGLGFTVIAHLETGRIHVGEKHLAKLLPAYGATAHSFGLFSSGTVELPQNPKSDCIDVIQRMNQEQLRTALPVLLSLAKQ